MVMLHCLEHGVGSHRVTEDADVAINVFTHRGGLREVTAELARRGFVDTSPEPMASRTLLSYRWTRGSTKVDLMVPELANAQESVPHAVNRRPSVEMPAVQQALARTERLSARLDDGASVEVHRPNLLGALVVKAAAAVQDSREPERHRGDLVALCTAIAFSGLHVTLSSQVSRKDIRRIQQAVATIRPAEWRRSEDPEAARAAAESLGATR